MTDRLYLMPIGLAASPQSEEGDAVRLAGGLVYAHRFAVIVRRFFANHDVELSTTSA